MANSCLIVDVLTLKWLHSTRFEVSSNALNRIASLCSSHHHYFKRKNQKKESFFQSFLWSFCQGVFEKKYQKKEN